MEPLPTDQPNTEANLPTPAVDAPPVDVPAVQPIAPLASPEAPVVQSPEMSAPRDPPPPPASPGVTASAHDVGSALNGPMPEELRRWSWAAFLMSWIWGVGHNVWIALLIFPLMMLFILPGVAFLIYLGLKGNELAWQHRKFESVDQFKQIQRAWTWWGVGINVVSLIIGVISWSFVAVALLGYLGNTDSPFNDSPGQVEEAPPDVQYQ